MAASVFARTLPASLSSRTIFVKCTPAPANFTERRAILKALATTSAKPKIEVFKKLEDSSSFIAVTTAADTAVSLVNESPFKRIVHTEDSAAAATFSTTAWGSGARTTITDPVIVRTPTQASEAASSSDATAKREEIGLKTKAFTIHIFPANVAYNHKRAIGLNPLHGPWPVQDEGSTYISSALRKSVPANAMAPALRDWETGQQLLGDSIGLEEEYASTMFGVWKQGQVFLRDRLRKKQRQEIPDVMKSLSAVAGRSRKAAEAPQKAVEPRQEVSASNTGNAPTSSESEISFEAKFSAAVSTLSPTPSQRPSSFSTAQDSFEAKFSESLSPTSQNPSQEAGKASRKTSASSEANTSFEAKFSEVISTPSPKPSRKTPSSF